MSDESDATHCIRTGQQTLADVSSKLYWITLGLLYLQVDNDQTLISLDRF
jgi:hypothetical protein